MPRRLLAAAVPLAVAMAAAPAAAQAPDWAKASPIVLTITDAGYTPRRITLQRGAPYVLRIVNRSGKGHNLTQEAFFRFARVDPRDRVWTRTGKVSLDAHQRALIRFEAPRTRAGGRYRFSSTVLGDAGGDYTGTFLIR